MKKLTIASFIGLGIILLSLAGAAYYVKKNYIPPKPTLTPDTLSMTMMGDNAYLSQDSSLSHLQASDTTHQPNSAPAADMVITSVLSDQPILANATTPQPDNKKLNTSKKETNKPINSEPSNKGAEAIIPAPKENVESISPPQSNPDSKAVTVATKGVESSIYYVVVGTFAQEDNAKDKEKELSAYKLSIIKDGNYFRLVAGKFPSAQSAKQKSQALTSEGITNFVIRK